MAFNSNALSDAEYWAYANAPQYLADLSYVPSNLAQTVAYGGAFNPDALSNADYYAAQQMYLNPGGAPQYYNPPQAPVQRAPAPMPVQRAPMPAPAQQYDPNAVYNMGTPYGSQIVGPFMVQPPQGWTPVSSLQYPYYG